MSSSLPRSFHSGSPGSAPNSARKSSRRNSSGGDHGTSSNGGTPSLDRRNRQFNVRANRTSPSPVRRSITPGGMRGGSLERPSGYRVALPKTLYGEDASGSGGRSMTQSMDPGALAKAMAESGDKTMMGLTQSLYDDRGVIISLFG